MPDEEKDKKPPVRRFSRLLKMLGVKFPDDTPKLQKKNEDNLNNYSPVELRHLPGFDKPDERDARNYPAVSQLSSYLKNISQGNADWADQVEAIRALTPEIDRSAEIMVASIMSPTDLQTDIVNVVCDNTDLGPELESKITEFLTDYFNDKLDIGDKTCRYVTDALYGPGSASILILPQSNVETLNKAADLDWIKSGRMSVLKDNVKELEKVESKATYSGEVFSSCETLITTDKIPAMESLIADKLRSSLEEHNPFNLPVDHIVTNSKDARNAILKLMAENNHSILITKDIDGLKKQQTGLEDKIEKMTKEVEKNFMFDKNNPAYLINDEYDHAKKQIPAIIELPTRAVVPIIIPGSPDKHIGYFILTDQWGSPIVYTSDKKHNFYGPRRLTEAATQAAFGSPNLYRFNSTQMTDLQEYELTSTIFGLTLRQLMENKLEEYGLRGATIEENDAITNCIFRQILMQKQCAMIFVPEPLMVYLRFNHRDDGTGKALTENLGTLLSLRTVLIMSGVMAATENSINNKTIEVSVDEKQSNVQQFLEMVRNAYINKKMMRFDVNPLTVQQDLIQKSLTIVPKGIKGLSDSLNVTTEHRSTGAIMPDNDLLEKFNEWVVTGLQVPHSALNQLSENEYSRSVATSNIYFSNNVKSKQKVVIRHMSKFVRLYAKYSYDIRQGIIDILVASDKEEKEKESSEEIKKEFTKSDMKIKMNEDKSIQRRLAMILDHLTIQLPAPRMAMDKSQYAELDTFIATAEKIAETIYSDDLLAGDAQELQDTLRIVRATIREQLTREYVKNVGMQSIYDLPKPTDLDIDSAMELIKLLSNKRKGVSDWMRQIAGKSTSDDSAMGGGMGGDMGGGMGGDMGGGDMGMGGDMGGGDMGGGDMGGGTGTGETGGGEAGGTTAANDFDNTPAPPSL